MQGGEPEVSSSSEDECSSSSSSSSSSSESSSGSSSSASDAPEERSSKTPPIRPPPPKKICTFWQKGKCLKGDRCTFAHPPRTSKVNSTYIETSLRAHFLFLCFFFSLQGLVLHRCSKSYTSQTLTRRLAFSFSVSSTSLGRISISKA